MNISNTNKNQTLGFNTFMSQSQKMGTKRKCVFNRGLLGDYKYSGRSVTRTPIMLE